MFNYFWKKINFSRLSSLTKTIIVLEKKISSATDEQIKKNFFLLKKKNQKKNKVEQEQFINKNLITVYALVKEIIKRKIGISLFPTQILGGVSLHYGNITQMNTGEGKTFSAFLPVCLNALTNRSIFVITVNEYLAERDCKLAKPVLDFFEIPSGFNNSQLSLEEKQELYKKKKVIYTTSNALVFDYLQNNLIVEEKNRLQTDYYYAIIDEVDSILLDEARDPLIISQTKQEKDKEKKSEKQQKTSLFSEQLKVKEDYLLDKKTKSVWLTNQGQEKAEKFYQIDNLFSFQNQEENFILHNSLKSKHFYLKNIDYVVINKKIVIINQLTGRLVPNQVYSSGIQQAIESKEKIPLSSENNTIATVTFQNFFRLFEKIAGMTGTASDEEKEFREVYGLEVVVIPPYKKLIRQDLKDLVFFTKKEKYAAVINKIKKIKNTTNQPILIGSSNVEVSEKISSLLNEEKIYHYKLNAVNHQKEAEIISQGGQIGSLIISTNMAGRGTDIILSEESRKKGGLFVIGIEDDFTRRTRQQLIGRAGRQGDPGKSQFFVSLKDNIITRFGAETSMSWLLRNKETLMDWGISSFIEELQEISSGLQTNQRKAALSYDLLINRQRIFIYKYRQEILLSKNSKKIFPHLNQKEQIFWSFLKKFILKKIDLFWTEYLSLLEKTKELICLKIYTEKDPQESFFWETLELFKKGFKRLKKELTKITL